MILQMFAVMDYKVQAFLAPFFARSRGEALRSFGDACADKSHMFCKHPNDYALFFVGEFDDDGAILTARPLVNLGSAADFVGVYAPFTTKVDGAGQGEVVSGANGSPLSS